MPIGPFAPIPATSPPQKIRLEHINELRVALSNLSDAFDVAQAEGFTGTRAEWLASLQGPPGAGTQSGETTGEAVAGIALSDGAGGAVETWLGTTADGGPTTYAISKLNDAGVGSGGGAVSSVNGQTGAVVLDAADIAGITLLTPHTFAAFASTGSEWEAGTYAQFITGLDAKLGGAATKTTLTTSGAENVYSYHSGDSTLPHVLIVGGQHGDEALGGWAAMRFFTEYVTSAAAPMAALRERVQITYVPWLNAGRYRSDRENANLVDLNRNWGYFWAYNTSTAKGAAAFDQNETAAIKTLIDGSTIACVIDCHTGSAGDAALSVISHRGDTVGTEQLTPGALARWDSIYNQGTYAFEEYGGSTISATPPSNLRGWALKYLRWTLNRHNAAAITIESDPAETGSTLTTTLTEGGATMYAGFIHAYIVTWLQAGQLAAHVVPMDWTVAHTTTTAITTTQAPVVWDTLPDGSTANTTAFLDIPLRAPGDFTAEVSLMLQASAAATVNTRVEVAIGWERSPTAGGNTTPKTDHTRGWVDIPTASGYATYHRTLRLEDTIGITDDAPLYRFQVFLDRVAGDADPNLLSATVTIRHQPDAPFQRLAVFDRAS